MGYRKCYWIWMRNINNFLLSLNIYFVPRRNFLCRPQIWPRKGRKILFSLILSSNQHYFNELLTNIERYLHCLPLVENGIFYYSKSDFLPIFRCSPLQTAIRHSMQHDPLTVNYRKQWKPYLDKRKEYISNDENTSGTNQLFAKSFVFHVLKVTVDTSCPT